MDGRFKSLVVGFGLLGTTVGCITGPTTQPAASSRKDALFTRTEKPTPAVDAKNLRPDTQLAIAALRVQLAASPDRPTAARDQDISIARTAYNQVLAKDAKNVAALSGMAELARIEGNKDAAIAGYRKAMQANPTNGTVCCDLARCQIQFQDWDGALESLQEATKREPDNRVYRKNLGFTLALRGRHEEAYAWLSRSMKESDARYCLAQVMQFQKKDDAAKQQLALALEVDPNFQTAKDFMTFLNEPAAIPQPQSGPIMLASQDQYAPLPNAPVPSATVPAVAMVPVTPTPAPTIVPAMYTAPVSAVPTPTVQQAMSIGMPEPLPLSMTRPVPNLIPSTGWDRKLPPGGGNGWNRN